MSEHRDPGIEITVTDRNPLYREIFIAGGGEIDAKDGQTIMRKRPNILLPPWRLAVGLYKDGIPSAMPPVLYRLESARGIDMSYDSRGFLSTSVWRNENEHESSRGFPWI